MATAYITLAMVIVHYILNYKDGPNLVDRAVAGKLWNVLSKEGSEPSAKWSKAIEEAVLMFSDQQLVTGIGILVSGYSQIDCALSTYHWEIVVYLAWFSSLTHLTTLTALRALFRKSYTLAYWRVFFIGCTIVLLATALAPTGYVSRSTTVDYFANGTPASPPISCLFSTARFNEAVLYEVDSGLTLEPLNWIFILVSLLFLLVSYISRVISLFTFTADKAQLVLITWPGYRLKKLIYIITLKSKSGYLSRRIFLTCVSFILMTVYVLLKMMFEVGQSMLWEVSHIFLKLDRS